MISSHKILGITLSLLLSVIVALILSSVFGMAGRGVFKTLLFVAPPVFLACGWYWSLRSTPQEIFASLGLFVFFVFLVYGYFSGSFVFSKDVFLLLSLIIIPFASGIIFPRLLRRFS